MDPLSETFCQRLCQQAKVGIVVADPALIIRMLNASAGALLGVTDEQVIGRPVDVIIPEYRRRIGRRLVERSAALARSVELRVVHSQGGAKRHLTVLIDPVFDSAGEVEAICLWIRDQTRRMELERRLAQIEKLASQGQLAGGLAHHFNNILGGIVTAVDHGLACDTLPAAKRALQLISRGAVSAVRMTRKLLDFSTPDLPDQNLVDLTEAVIAFAEQAQEGLSGTALELDVDVKSVPIIAVDEVKMRQILDGLLANSRQAIGDRPGKIKVTVEGGDGKVRVVFQDDGPGISWEVAQRMFDPFFTTRGPIGGGSDENLGLGLTLAGRLAEEIGGVLHYCADCPEPGACFVVEFALRGSDAEAS